MRISIDTLKVLIDCADPEAYRAWSYLQRENLRAAELYSWDGGVFYLCIPPSPKWYVCTEPDLGVN